jgi:hypothetical protein
VNGSFARASGAYWYANEPFARANGAYLYANEPFARANGAYSYKFKVIAPVFPPRLSGGNGLMYVAEKDFSGPGVFSVGCISLEKSH